MKRTLPWLVEERPDLFLAYHRTQWPTLERSMKSAAYIASFIGHEPGRAIFAGLFEIEGHRPIRFQEFWADAAHRELRSYGMVGMSAARGELARFDLASSVHFCDWIGKLVVDWPPPERSWFRRAQRNQIAVHAILEESWFTARMPDWTELKVRWGELNLLPRSWAEALRHWRGVYFIFDRSRRSGYVGSASGSENILGRWLDYGRTGHGGNRQLRQSHPEDLEFTILQRTSPDLLPGEVIAIEQSWKRRLHTREFGLNEN